MKTKTGLFVLKLIFFVFSVRPQVIGGLGINDLISWFFCNSLSLNITKTDSIILSRSISSITLTHSFLISLPILNTITTLGFTINNALDYSVHI